MLRRRRLRPGDPLVYELVELRRQQRDLMMWQVPILTLTGQAFLFTIILGGETSSWARILAGVMSIGVTVLAMLLLARQRQSEQADAVWLDAQEVRWGPNNAQHGQLWAQRRDAQLPGYSDRQTAARRIRKKRNLGWGGVPLVAGYKTWVVAHWLLIAFTVCSVLIALSFDLSWFEATAPLPSVSPTP